MQVNPEDIFYLLPAFLKTDFLREHQWLEAYYLQKDTTVKEGGAVLRDGWRYAPMVDFYIDNWLMASFAVGFARVLEHAGFDPEKYFQGRLLSVPPEVWQRVPELYADFLLKEGFEDVLRSSVENLKGEDLEGIKNPLPSDCAV